MTRRTFQLHIPALPALATHPSIQARHLPVRLNHKLCNLALRVAWAALDENDNELAAIMQYAINGECTDYSTIGDLADRILALKKKARALGDKKMLRVLDAAIKNGC